MNHIENREFVIISYYRRDISMKKLIVYIWINVRMEIGNYESRSIYSRRRSSKLHSLLMPTLLCNLGGFWGSDSTLWMRCINEGIFFEKSRFSKLGLTAHDQLLSPLISLASHPSSFPVFLFRLILFLIK